MWSVLVGAWTLSVVRTDLSRMRLGLGCCVDHFLELLDGVKVLLDREARAHGVDRDMGRAPRLLDLQVAHRLLSRVRNDASPSGTGPPWARLKGSWVSG
jgi:hypothetical protein